MNVKNSVLDNIRYKQLNCYGHVRRLNEERLPQKVLEEEEKEILEIRGCRKNCVPSSHLAVFGEIFTVILF